MRNLFIEDTLNEETGTAYRIVQLESFYAPEVNTQYSTFARFSTDGSVVIVTTEHTIERGVVTETQSVRIDATVMDKLVKEWQAKPFQIDYYQPANDSAE